MSTDFYHDLPKYRRFASIADPANYAAVPHDWTVLLSDVVGSTKAIREGRYKDVNMVGAATITCVLNAVEPLSVPFVFGGDGGTIVVPPEAVEKAKQALLSLKSASESIFGLGLRAGAIPVSEIAKRGAALTVGKFELSANNNLAMFGGEGLEMADTLLKDPDPANPFLLNPDENTGPPDLEGLSCRWEPLQTHRGKMLTMMIKPLAKGKTSENARLAEITQSLERHLGHSPSEAAPANDRTMRFRWPPRGLMIEVRAAAAKGKFIPALLHALMTSTFQWACEKFKIKVGDYDGASYRYELQTNTDYRKYDGVLRLVLDVSDEQHERLSTWLEQEHAKGHLIYGLHTTDAALMTCLLFSLEQSEHIHFIDGSNGGFAMAAVGYKQQLKALEGNK